MNTFKFAPVSDRIKNLREKRDVFNNGALIKLNIERTSCTQNITRHIPLSMRC
jgi:hypothetical protein